MITNLRKNDPFSIAEQPKGRFINLFFVILGLIMALNENFITRISIFILIPFLRRRILKELYTWIIKDARTSIQL
jgi:hypothetical protein